MKPRAIVIFACTIALITGSSVRAATVYDDGVAGPVSEVTLGDFRPDLSVHGRTVGSIPNTPGDNLDGARVYIWDFLDVTFSRYAMLVFEMDQPYDGVRLYTHQDHYSGGPITTAFVAQDVMEYSVWGSNAVEPTTLADWVLLSDVIAYDIIGGGAGKPTYTFAGLDGGEASIVFRGGSPEFGVVNAYTREYHFSSTYKWFGFRSSTVSIVAGDADPELDAIGGFSQIDRNPPPTALCQDVTVNADANCQGSASIDNGSFDPDGGAVTLVQSPPGPYPLGQTTVTLTVTDPSGETDQCQATVTVVDNTPPVVHCPGDITVDNEPGQCGLVVNYALTLTQNCPGVTFGCTRPSGSIFPVGTTQVTCTATDAAGNTAECSFTVTVTEGFGSIVGTLSANCSVLGVTIDAFDPDGILVGVDVTDAAGDYSIPNLPAGITYTVSVVDPLGYTASPNDRQVDLLCNETVRCDFSLECPTNAGAQRTIGFWKHQVGVATGGKGHAQIDAATLCGYLDLIASHFNGNAINAVIIYVPPGTGVCDDKLVVAKNLLNLKGNVGMTARARQQLMALLLNVASGKLAQTAIISADGATVSQAITYADNLIDDALGDHETAKTICDEINNNQQVAAGVIPVTTPDIAYRVIPEGFILHQNYPNPFNAGTIISYALENDGPARLEIFDVLGRSVITLVDEVQTVGLHQVAWNGADRNGQTVSSGMYFYRLTAGDVAMTRKMVLLK